MSALSTSVSRRGFLKWILGSGAVGAVSLLSGGVYITKIEPRCIEIVRVDIPIQGLPDTLQGFTIAQLSDFHVGPHVKAEDVHQAVEIANKLAPDLVVLTGDYVSESAQHSAACARELAALKAEHGVHAILGNHDFWTDADVVAANLRQAGLDVLRNEHRWLKGDVALYKPGHGPDCSGGAFPLPPGNYLVVAKSSDGCYRNQSGVMSVLSSPGAPGSHPAAGSRGFIWARSTHDKV